MDTFVCSVVVSSSAYPSPHLDTGGLRPRRRALLGCRSTCTSAAPSTPSCTCSSARFFCKVLNDAGYVDFGEPYATLRNQGFILAEDGTKMSKSKGNIVTPDSVVERYAAPTACASTRLFIAPFEQSVAWNDRGVQGCLRFLTRFWGSHWAWPGSPVRRRAAAKPAPADVVVVSSPPTTRAACCAPCIRRSAR